MNDDMMLMWLNWSVAIINATLQLLDIYRLVANPCDARVSLKKDNSAIIYWIVTFFEYDVCFKIT